MVKKKKKKTATDEYLDDTVNIMGAGVVLGAGNAAVGAMGGNAAVSGAFGTAAGFLPVAAGLSVMKLANNTLVKKKKKKKKQGYY